MDRPWNDLMSFSSWGGVTSFGSELSSSLCISSAKAVQASPRYPCVLLCMNGFPIAVFLSIDMRCVLGVRVGSV